MQNLKDAEQFVRDPLCYNSFDFLHALIKLARCIAPINGQAKTIKMKINQTKEPALR